MEKILNPVGERYGSDSEIVMKRKMTIYDEWRHQLVRGDTVSSPES